MHPVGKFNNLKTSNFEDLQNICKQSKHILICMVRIHNDLRFHLPPRPKAEAQITSKSLSVEFMLGRPIILSYVQSGCDWILGTFL